MRSLCAHAEAVLLVDDQQAEVLERDVLLQQAVRADDDVDLPVREPLQRPRGSAPAVRKRDSISTRTG